MAYRISLQNEGGEIDVRVVETEEEIRAATLDIIGGISSMLPGDKLVVSEQG